MDSFYEKLSKERKTMQENCDMPMFFTTGGWQLFKKRYLYDAKTPREQYQRIASTLAKYIDVKPDWMTQSWEEAFFEIMWEGTFSPSTPLLSNTGTNRGFTVSCSGNTIPNNIQDIYERKMEVAALTKYGFGTASYLGDISPRGTILPTGVECTGVVPVIEGFVHDMRYVAQGSNRRGAWAGYLPIDHGDFFELVDYLKNHPDDLNIGWNVSQSFIDRLNSGDSDAVARFQKAMATKLITGKGYFFFPDKANAQRPQIYVDKDLKIVAPQLCNEIMLHSSEDYTYTCVLGSMVATQYEKYKDKKHVFIATVLLDCVCSDFIAKAKGKKGMERAVRFTEASRALGLGICGFHTALQQKMIPYEGFEAHMFNNEIFKHMADESLEASKWMAEVLGEPEWCKGYSVRNTHRTAVAPTKSTALIMGGISEGINPDTAMTFTQLTPAGEVDRANPTLLALMKERGVYDKKHFQQLTDGYGSVQHVDWLTDEEKLVFRTAFEINQEAVIRLASSRQRYICQYQSVNLFFSADEPESTIAKVHQQAFEDENILGLYYCYSKAGVQGSKGECLACQ